MTNLEKQIDLLVRYTVTDDEELKKQLREELAATIQEKDVPAETSPYKIEDTTEDLLDELGVPHHLLGRDYIVTAISLILEDPENLHQITYMLYPAIADKYNSTATRVERAIRHAVESAWLRGNYGILKELFGNTVDRDKGKPTNCQFLAACTKIVSRRVRDIA